MMLCFADAGVKVNRSQSKITSVQKNVAGAGKVRASDWRIQCDPSGGCSGGLVTEDLSLR